VDTAGEEPEDGASADDGDADDSDVQDTTDDPREPGAVVEAFLVNAGDPDGFPCPVAELADGQRFHLVNVGIPVEDDVVIEDAWSFEYDYDDRLLLLQVRLAGEDLTAPATGEVLAREGDPFVFTTSGAAELSALPFRDFCGDPDEELLFIEVELP
jgi:hypothetical protein